MPNINKNIIMQAGAAVANATNKAAGLSASTPEPGTVISAIQLVNGGRTIGPDALAHFAESVRNKLLSLVVSMEPIQDFNGYGHPWPAGGGANKIAPKDITTTINGVSVVASSTSETIELRGTATSSGGRTTKLSELFTLPAGTYYLFAFGNTADVALNNSANTLVKWANGSFTLESDTSVYIGVNVVGGNAYNETIKVALVSGSTAPTAWSPYSNTCPITGRTGLEVFAGPTSAIEDTATYSMDWTSPARTVYAGSADIVTGDIKAAPYYASYNGETLVGPWVSSMDVYDPDGTPTTGAQVVDLGGTMTDYHITGQDIITLVGDNYIWSDSGDVTITE